MSKDTETTNSFLTCPGCDSPLMRIEWNSDVDMYLCDNYKCQLFHRPAHPQTPKSTDTQKKAVKFQGVRVPAWLGGQRGTENTEFSRRLQRLKYFIYVEDKEKS